MGGGGGEWRGMGEGGGTTGFNNKQLRMYCFVP